MGAISRDEFAALPQLGANLRWQVSDHLEVTCGYSWLLLTSALQTGDQIDRTVDPSQLSPLLDVPGNPAPAERPENPFRQTAFWAHGVNVGIQFSY